MTEKNFDEWNRAKKRLHQREAVTYAHSRDVWWCALGLNVGSEIDGKHENFERPVLVVREYGNETLLVLPISSKTNDRRFYRAIRVGTKILWVVLTQLRVLSNKRLLRKIGSISEVDLEQVKSTLIEYL